MCAFWRFGVRTHADGVQPVRREDRRADTVVAMIHCTLPYYWTNEPHMDWDKYQRELEMSRLREKLEDIEIAKAEQAREIENDEIWND